MDNYLKEIFTPFKYLGVALLIEFVVVLSFFTALYSSYDMNLFEVNLNGIEMKCVYTEKYSNGFLVNAGIESHNNVEHSVNRIDLNDKIILNINEYEVYYQSGNRKQNTNGWKKQDNLNYVKVNDSKIKIEIKRMNKVLYNGDYIYDLSAYMNEKGRYYIHIYSTRKDGLLSSVKTHISFNVIVGGGNYE